MRVLIDADACPVVDIAVALCKKYHIRCLLLCDTAHEIVKDGADTLVFDKSSDSVDFALVNRVNAGDLVITQDYGLAAMCLARHARVMHQDGWEYNEWNIGGLLEQRHAAKKARASGSHMKGPSKRTATQNETFSRCFDALLQQTVQG